MRAMFLVMGLACLALATAEHADQGKTVPGKDWTQFASSANGEVFSTVSGCATVGAQYCAACENPYMLCYDCAYGSVLHKDNSGCKDCDDTNCKECEWNADDTTTTCNECKSGFYLLADGTCIACGTNCQECEPDTVGGYRCTECDPRSETSVLVPSDCIGCGSNCASCSIAPDDSVTCNTCDVGYYVNDKGRCDSCPSRCDTCSKPDKTKLCSACSGKYQLSTDTTKCLPCDTGCATCSGQATNPSRAACTTCDSGYYLANEECIRCTTGCAECSLVSGSEACDTCESGYYLDGTSCTECSTACKDCSDDVSCNECNTGYTTKSATSIVCDKCPANCDSCTATQALKGECATCSDGYYRDSNVCKPCSTKCRACSSATVCTDCMTGYNLADNDACYECPSNCANDSPACDYNTTLNVVWCTTCLSGFAIDTAQTTCQACSVGCDGECRYDAASASLTECRCPLNAAPDININTQQYRGGCTSGATVYACKEGYYYDDTLTAPDCTACPTAGCVHCNGSIPTVDCLDCNTNGYLAAPTAFDNCFACDDIHSKCLACSSTTVCTSCSEGYGVLDGSCKACGSLCAECTWTGTGTAATSSCGNCKTNGFQDPSVAANCLACPANCNSCGVDVDGNPVCNSGGCNTGYAWNNDECFKCPTNCNDCSFDLNGDIVCDACVDTYADNDLVCTRCPSDCDTCSESGGEVTGTQAADRYYLDDQSLCKKCPENCLTCSDSSCSACADGYGLSTDRKQCTGCGVLTGVDNCDDCDSADSSGVANCLDCANGYVISDNHKYCNLTSRLGSKCTRHEDHYPECTTCDGDRYLKLDDNGDYEFPKDCLYECYSCGTVDQETKEILTGTDEECNPKKDANYTLTEPCYDGVCGVSVKLDGKNKREMAARGCARNTTCDDSKKKNTIQCIDAEGSTLCGRCCNGDLCNDEFFSAGGVVYANIAVLLVALANALSLK